MTVVNKNRIEYLSAREIKIQSAVLVHTMREEGHMSLYAWHKSYIIVTL